MKTSGNIEENTARLLKCLAHPSRLAIITRLGNGEKCVRKFSEELDLRQPNVSQHLRILRHCGLVLSRRKGNMVCYRLSHPGLANVVRAARKAAKQMRK